MGTLKRCLLALIIAGLTANSALSGPTQSPIAQTSTFVDSGQSLGNSISYGLALDDLDGDGDLDAFVGNYYEANKVWLNDGAGTFVDSGQALGWAWSEVVALGDLDDDGDLDVFVGNTNANQVWLNQRGYAVYLPLVQKP